MIKRRLFAFIIIGLLLVAFFGCSKEQKKKSKAVQIQEEASADLPKEITSKGVPQSTAKQIIDKIAHAYSSCKSYYDEGVVTTVFFHDKLGKRTTKRPFTTAFVRPDRFRFEFKNRRGEEEWDQYIVWRDGGSVHTWWSIQPGIKNRNSLGMALAGATGVSGGSAHKIPKLLMPDEIKGWNLANLIDPELLDDEDVNAISCSKIQGKHLSGDVNTLWVEKRSYLVRKIATQRSFPDFRTETTTTYNPRFDIDIRPDQLEFNPPVE